MTHIPIMRGRSVGWLPGHLSRREGCHTINTGAIDRLHHHPAESVRGRIKSHFTFRNAMRLEDNKTDGNNNNDDLVSVLLILLTLAVSSQQRPNAYHHRTITSLYTIHRCNLIFIVNNIRKTCSFFHYFILNLKKLKLPF